MATISRLLLGLSKKGITPIVTENTGQGACKDFIEFQWNHAGKDISVFFDKLTGKYKGFERSVTTGRPGNCITETVSAERIVDQPNFRTARYHKSKITGEYVFNKYGEDYTNTHRESTSKVVTTSIDPEANIFTVLTQNPPGDTTVKRYNDIKIFQLPTH